MPASLAEVFEEIQAERVAENLSAIELLAKQAIATDETYRVVGMTYSVKNSFVRLKSEALNLSQTITEPIAVDGRQPLVIPARYHALVAVRLSSLMTALVGPISKRKTHNGKNITPIAESILVKIGGTPGHANR